MWCYKVEETDAQYESRIALEKAKTEKKQAKILKERQKQRLLYEKLKKEFEP